MSSKTNMHEIYFGSTFSFLYSNKDVDELKTLIEKAEEEIVFYLKENSFGFKAESFHGIKTFYEEEPSKENVLDKIKIDGVLYEN